MFTPYRNERKRGQKEGMKVCKGERINQKAPQGTILDPPLQKKKKKKKENK